MAAELGVLGLLSYLGFLAGAAVMIERIRRRDQALGLALGAVLLALVVHSLAYSGFFEDPVTWVVSRWPARPGCHTRQPLTT